ncbi:jg1441 [Pararge aegeria aegeria]|uniref:Jg1441 protein n=1 Tax=Pararge aegeria aegeria TaxID=348720 RepID=A0A8S4QKF3_9NEOP|nr:jg1441 [Pararge aegeria aegeria]
MKLKPRVSFKPADQSPSIKQEKKSVSPNHWPSNRANLHESRIFLASRLAQNEFDELFTLHSPSPVPSAERSFVKNTPDPTI